MPERQIVLDTETTGLDPAQGHRIIEIGCIELVNRRQTDRRFHTYLQPDRAIDEGAVRVHGITNDFLADKPRFPDIADPFLDFVRDAELIIHNAPFDLGFLNHELQLCGRGQVVLEQLCAVEDTLRLARQRHPGQRNSLDALCKRYNIDNSQRTLHGALLDAEILADVYLAMTRQQSSMFEPVTTASCISRARVSYSAASMPHRHIRSPASTPEYSRAYAASRVGASGWVASMPARASENRVV